MTKGRTSLIISHRLSSIVHADEIIVLKNGEVEAIGDCSKLLNSDRTFCELFAAQAKRLEMTAVGIQ